MRKYVSLVLFAFLLMNFCIASAADYSSMSEEMLEDEFNLIRNELVSRGLGAENKRVIVDQDDVQVYINGDIYIGKEHDWDKEYTLFVPIVVINNTEYAIDMMAYDSSINGWMVDDKFSDESVQPKKKIKSELLFEVKDAEIDSTEEFEDIVFSLVVYDKDSWNHNLFYTEPITIVAK